MKKHSGSGLSLTPNLSPDRNLFTVNVTVLRQRLRVAVPSGDMNRSRRKG